MRSKPAANDLDDAAGDLIAVLIDLKRDEIQSTGEELSDHAGGGGSLMKQAALEMEREPRVVTNG